MKYIWYIYRSHICSIYILYMFHIVIFIYVPYSYFHICSIYKIIYVLGIWNI